MSALNANKAVQISDPKIRSMSFVVNKGDEEWAPRNPEARFLGVKASSSDIEAAKKIVAETRKGGGNDILSAIRIMSSRNPAMKAGLTQSDAPAPPVPTMADIARETRAAGGNAIFGYLRAAAKLRGPTPPNDEDPLVGA